MKMNPPRLLLIGSLALTLNPGCHSPSPQAREAQDRLRETQAQAEILDALRANPRGSAADPYGRVGPTPDLVRGVADERAKSRQQAFERELGDTTTP